MTWLLEFVGTFGALALLLHNPADWLPEARAILRVRRGLLAGRAVGCDYRDPDAHLAQYPLGAVHLCSDACVHEPPEER